MKLTGQNHGGTVSSASLLTRNAIDREPCSRPQNDKGSDSNCPVSFLIFKPQIKLSLASVQKSSFAISKGGCKADMKVKNQGELSKTCSAVIGETHFNVYH